MFLAGEQEEACIRMFSTCSLYGSWLADVSSLMACAVYVFELDDMPPVKRLLPFQIPYRMMSLHGVPLWQYDLSTLYLDCHRVGQTAVFLDGQWYSPRLSLLANLKPSIVLFRNITH
jgi:hypothetical protein